MGAKMRGGFLLFFAFGITLAKNENAVSRLIDDLFDDAGYNKDVVPMQKPADETTNVNAINIAVGLSVISMGLNPAGILHASTWLRTSWSDYRLKWNPAHYEGLKSIRIPPNMVWKPDLSVYNAADFGSGSFDDRFVQNNYLILLFSDGVLLWIPALHMDVDCMKGKVFPNTDNNEPQKCNIKIGSWTYDGLHLNLTALEGKEFLELGDMSKNSQYVVVSQEGEAIQTKYYPCCKEPYMAIDYRFRVQKAFSIQNGEKVFNKSPEEIEKIF